MNLRNVIWCSRLLSELSALHTRFTSSATTTMRLVTAWNSIKILTIQQQQQQKQQHYALLKCFTVSLIFVRRICKCSVAGDLVPNVEEKPHKNDLIIQTGRVFFLASKRLSKTHANCFLLLCPSFVVIKIMGSKLILFIIFFFFSSSFSFNFTEPFWPVGKRKHFFFAKKEVIHSFIEITKWFNVIIKMINRNFYVPFKIIK